MALSCDPNKHAWCQRKTPEIQANHRSLVSQCAKYCASSGSISTPLGHPEECCKSQNDRVMEGQRVCVRDLGEATADTFTIMKLAGHTSVTVSQRQNVLRRQSLRNRSLDLLETRNRRHWNGRVGRNPPKSTHMPVFAIS
jgi:hypothetical protein